MIERPLERRTPLPPLLGRRVELLGLLAFILFAVVTFRLWYLQILTGHRNVTLANANVARDVAVAAPRGQIVDRHGRVLATVQSAAIAAVLCKELPAPGPARRALYGRLASALSLPERQIATTVGVWVLAMFSAVTASALVRALSEVLAMLSAESMR